MADTNYGLSRVVQQVFMVLEMPGEFRRWLSSYLMGPQLCTQLSENEAILLALLTLHKYER